MNGRYIRNLLAGALCLLAFAAACGLDGAQSPGPLDSTMLESAPAGSAQVSTPALLVPTPTPAIRAGQPPRKWSVSPSLDEQVFDSDTIVRATLLSAVAGTESVPGDPGVAPTHRAVNELRFTVHEYLKGSGPSEVVVVVRDEASYPGTVGTFVLEADALGRAQEQLQRRRTTWDDREAVLFLRTGGPSQSGGASGGSQRTAQNNPAIEFTQSNPVFQTPFDYSIDTLSRAWLPSRDAGATGASRSADREYITDGSASPPPTISLTALRSKIAELETTLAEGAGIEGFRECIRGKISYERVERAYEDTEHSTPSQFEATLASGSAAGTEFFRKGNSASYWDTQYVRLWLSGPDMDRFQALVDDDDSDVGNGYDHTLALARPLPAGEYRVTYTMQHEDRFPCNFIPRSPYGEWTVTVTAPAGTLHEAFFDPVTVGMAVEADATNGVLEPTSFTDTNDASATLQSLAYELPTGSGSGTVKLQVDPHTGLGGHRLDFIELDGSVSLSLEVDSATVDTANGTLSWPVSSQPWDDGDRLMLRIAEVVLGIALFDVPLTITVGQSEPFTVQASGLSATESYRLRMSTASSALGFGSGCGTGSRTLSVPSGSTSHSIEETLYGCRAMTGTVTATLLEGMAGLETAIATATAEVVVESTSSVAVTLSPRAEQYFTYTDMTVEWTDTLGCDSRYLVGLYSNETIVRNLGFHPAPGTTSLDADPQVYWDDIPDLDWTVRVTCAPDDGSGWTVVGETSLQSGLPSGS